MSKKSLFNNYYTSRIANMRHIHISVSLEHSFLVSNASAPSSPMAAFNEYFIWHGASQTQPFIRWPSECGNCTVDKIPAVAKARALEL